MSCWPLECKKKRGSTQDGKTPCMLQWYQWRYEMKKKKDEEKRMVDHQQFVSRMIAKC